VNRLSLGSVNSCIPSLVAGSTIATAAFFSCDSPTALPSFVLKDGGILLSGLSFNQQTGVPASTFRSFFVSPSLVPINFSLFSLLIRVQNSRL
jgi:hypothetical protein